ncbi:MAG: ABC transporter permease, partial [Clostridia bacterium]|nr:ABC transporter permease [Clostridia bacterium]
NIGAEGQICVGAVAASYFALFHADWPWWLLFPAMMASSFLCAGLWGAIPAVFKARFGANETLFTLMLNYIALCFLKYLQNGPWKDPAMRGFPKIAMISDAARLPQVFGVHIGWIVAIVLVFIVYFYVRHTKPGFEITVVGESPRTARYLGMNVGTIMMRTMCLSGALCGIVGFLQVSGADYTLHEATAGGAGFTAITVAWLSGLHPVPMIVVSSMIAVVTKGAGKIQTTFKIPASAADVLTGVLLFFMLGSEFFIRYRLIWRGTTPAREIIDG